MALTAAELRATYSVDESELDKSLGGLEGKVKSAAAKVAAGAAVLGAGLAGGIMQSFDNERVNDQLAAQLGLSQERSAEIGRVAGSLYANAYGESLGDVNTAVGAVMSSISGMRDASTADIEAITATALDFATAFETDVTAASNTAGMLIRNGLATDATQAFDLMTASFQRVPAAMREELPAILDEYGTNFRALGFTGEQAFQLLTDAAQQGPFVLDKMGDALKEFTILGTDMSTGSVAAYESIGLSAEEMAGRIATGGAGAQDALQQVAQGILGIQDPAARANTAIALFGTPLEDLSVDQIPAFLSSIAQVGPGMTDAAGAAERMGTTLNDNASTNLETFKRKAIDAFVNVVGGQVIPAIQTVIGWLRSFGEWVMRNQTPIMIVAGVLAAVFGPALIAMGVQATIAAARVAAAFVVTKVQALASVAAQTAAMAGVVAGWVLMGAQAMIQAVRMAAAWVLAMGPVGWIIATVIALVALIVANWDAIVNATQAAWDWVTGIISGAWDWISGVVTGAAEAVWGAITGAWDAVVGATQAAWDWVTGVISGAWNSIVGGISGALQGIWGAITSVWNGITGFIGGVIRGISDTVLGVWNGMVSGIRSAFDGVASFLSGIFDGIGSGIRSAINAVIRVINTGIGFINNNLIDTANSIPFVNIPHIPQIPLLANGAIINRPTLAVVGDAGPEAVIPLSPGRAGRRQQLMEQAGLTAPPPAASTLNDSGARHGGALVNIENWHEESKSPDKLANELNVLARTGSLG